MPALDECCRERVGPESGIAWQRNGWLDGYERDDGQRRENFVAPFQCLGDLLGGIGSGNPDETPITARPRTGSCQRRLNFGAGEVASGAPGNFAEVAWRLVFHALFALICDTMQGEYG